MGKAEDEIEKKLMELEMSIKEDEAEKKSPAAGSPSPSLITAATLEQKYNEKEMAKELVSIDLYTMGGAALLASSLLMLFAHLRVGTPLMSGLFGIGGHIGFILVPMFVGIGMLFYNYKSRIAQLVTAGGVALILFAMLSQLVMTFPMVSMLDLMVMVVPLVAGIAFLGKAREQRKAIESRTPKREP